MCLRVRVRDLGSGLGQSFGFRSTEDRVQVLIGSDLVKVFQDSGDWFKLFSGQWSKLASWSTAQVDWSKQVNGSRSVNKSAGSSRHVGSVRRLGSVDSVKHGQLGESTRSTQLTRSTQSTFSAKQHEKW